MKLVLIGLIILGIYVAGGEGVSRLLFGREWIVDDGSNDLSGTQDVVVALWPIWVGLALGLLWSAGAKFVAGHRSNPPDAGLSFSNLTSHFRTLFQRRVRSESPTGAPDTRAGNDSVSDLVERYAAEARAARSPERVALDEQRKREESKRKARRRREPTQFNKPGPGNADERIRLATRQDRDRRKAQLDLDEAIKKYAAEARAARSPERVALDEQRKREELERKARRKAESDRKSEQKWALQEEHYLAHLPSDERAGFEALTAEEKRKALISNTKAAKLSRDWAARAAFLVFESGPEEERRFESLTFPQKKRRIEFLERKAKETERIREEMRSSRPSSRATPHRELRSGVKTRLPEDADDFELVCAEWATGCGMRAKRTPKGPDGGLDIVGTNLAGQCKFHPANKVGAPDIQQLAGAAQQAGKTKAVFFHYGPGFTQAAIDAARALKIELWQLDPSNQTFRKVS